MRTKHTITKILMVLVAVHVVGTFTSPLEAQEVTDNESETIYQRGIDAANQNAVHVVAGETACRKKGQDMFRADELDLTLKKYVELAEESMDILLLLLGIGLAVCGAHFLIFRNFGRSVALINTRYTV